MTAALAFGRKHALLAAVSGSVFYGFLIWPEEGAANLLTAFFFGGLLYIIGSISQKRKSKTDTRVVFQYLMIILYIWAGLGFMYLLYNLVLQLNSVLGLKDSIIRFDTKILFNFWIKDGINFTFLLIGGELLLTLSPLRKFLGLSAGNIMKKNIAILFKTLIGGFIIFIIFTALYGVLIEGDWQSKKPYISITLFTITYSSFIVARILIGYMNKQLLFRNQLALQNEEYLELNRKLSETNTQLILAKEKAEESDKLKTAFLTNITHEIRTPLNGILGFASLLEMELSKQEHKRYAQLITQSSNRLLLAINDVLDIAKIEAGQMQVECEEININELLKELYDFFNEQNLKIKFFLDLPPGRDIIICSDKSKLYQILNNLLGNAVKFTEEGYVKLSCKTEAKHIQIDIEDTGCGIDEKEKDMIFKRFHQSDKHKQAKNSGTGLGLAIAKEFTELLGGEIWFRSEAGKGTRFCVRLPVTNKICKQ